MVEIIGAAWIIGGLLLILLYRKRLRSVDASGELRRDQLLIFCIFGVSAAIVTTFLWAADDTTLRAAFMIFAWVLSSWIAWRTFRAFSH
jgi:hypothetical protein